MATVTITHAPSDYQCPYCALAAGVDADGQQDIVRRTAEAIALVSPHWWPNNHGNLLVGPVRHYENLYELPAEAGHAVHDLVREVAIAMRRTYGCGGGLHAAAQRASRQPERLALPRARVSPL